MANPEHVARLKVGAREWNQWRSENKKIKIDLSGADLTDTDFNIEGDSRDSDFSDPNDATLPTVNLTGVDLSRADLAA